MKQRSELVFWLAFHRILCQSPRVARSLLELYRTPSEVFRSLTCLPSNKNIYEDKEEWRLTPEVTKPLSTNIITAFKTFNEWELCESDVKRCDSENIHVITFDDPSYPPLIKEIADPPILLMVKGDREVLQGPCISIVGARKATSHGKDVAFEIGRDLAHEGFVVVSGMAYGIDAAAHHGAMEEGGTVAVWGSGIDRCYPAVFRDLAHKIEKKGCLVSEFPMGTPPDRWNFPQRNRIISGLSLGVVIVEAAAQSGSLITARFALEQGREVFAVPGPAGGTMSQGTHMLLRSGATFVERAEDILTSIAPQLPSPSKNSRHFGSDDINDRPLIRHIPFDGVILLDEIIRESGLSSAEVMTELSVLVVEGVIEELPGKQYRRKKQKM